VTLADHPAEGLDLVIREGHDGMEAEEPRQQGPINRTLILLGRAQQAGGPEGCQGAGAPSELCSASKGAGAAWRHVNRVPVSCRN
jgi:hypothetical protein